MKIDLAFLLLCALIIALIFGAIGNINSDRRLTALEEQLSFTAENQLYNEQYNADYHAEVDELLSQSVGHALNQEAHR